jgi:phosphatidate cytidylyltransferase
VTSERNEFGRRAVTAIVGVLLIIGCVFFGTRTTAGLFLVLGFFGLVEAVRLGRRTPEFPTFLAIMMLAIASAAGIAETRVVGRLVVIPMIVALFVFRAMGRPKILPVMYPILVVAGFSGAVSLRASAGPGALMTVFACTWAADTGAYLVGCRWGKTPLAPSISPKKTREGSLGGLAFALLVGVIAGVILDRTAFGLAAGIIAGSVGQIGDLAESRLKRLADEKDSGRLLPGHGGVLDRFDAFLVNACFSLLFA